MSYAMKDDKVVHDDTKMVRRWWSSFITIARDTSSSDLLVTRLGNCKELEIDEILG